MKKPVAYAALAALLLLPVACQGTPETATVQAPAEPVQADPRKHAYEACLEDHMTTAMAWEAVEQTCREKTSKPVSLLPGPASD